MADEILTFAALNAALPDNAEGIVDPQAIRNLALSGMVHAEIGAQNKSPITLGASFEAVDLDTDGAAKRGFNVDLVNHKLTEAPVDEKVRLEWQAEFKGSAGELYEWTVFRNGTQRLDRLDSWGYVATVNDIVHVGSVQTALVAANDNFTLAVKSAGNSLELIRGVLRAERIGVE